jgi:hypothetical protein
MARDARGTLELLALVLGVPLANCSPGRCDSDIAFW